MEDLQKKINKIQNHNRAKKLEEVQIYLNDKLREQVDNPTAEVVSLLIYQKGGMKGSRINCYLNQIKDSELFRELNMSTQIPVHYSNTLPTKDAYAHGTFVPMKQNDQDGVSSRFKRKISDDFPENCYIALGRNISAEDLGDLVTYSY